MDKKSKLLIGAGIAGVASSNYNQSVWFSSTVFLVLPTPVPNKVGTGVCLF